MVYISDGSYGIDLLKKRSMKSKLDIIKEVAGYFRITVDKPFSGKFYFETIEKS